MVLTVFNQKTLYDAYKKRTKNVNVDLEEYNKMKESDPEFYREASSLQYGKVLLVPLYNFDHMCNYQISEDIDLVSLSCRHLRFQRIRLTIWWKNSRTGRRSESRLAVGGSSTKTRISILSMIVMNISTKRLSGPLVDILWRSKTILSEELHCLIKVFCLDEALAQSYIHACIHSFLLLPSFLCYVLNILLTRRDKIWDPTSVGEGKVEQNIL